MTAPDVRGRLRGDPRARRQGRRGRPAAHAHAPSSPTSTCSIRPGTDALLLLASCTCSSPRASSRRAPGRARRRASTRSRDAGAPFTPEAVARPTGIAADDDPAARARARRRADAPRSTGASARRRRRSARPRAGSSTCSTSLTGNLDRAGRRDVPARRAARANAAASRAAARGARFGRWASRVRGAAARSSASCPSPCLAEEIETPGEGQVRALITIAGNPVVSHAERASAWPRALDVARLHGQRRPLPQRDDAPRRRDPAGARRRWSARTTTSRSTASRCATSPTTRRRVLERPTACPTSGETLLRLAGDRHRPGPGRRRRRARRHGRRRGVAAAARGVDARDAVAAPRARAAARPHAARRARTS